MSRLNATVSTILIFTALACLLLPIGPLRIPAMLIILLIWGAIYLISYFTQQPFMEGLPHPNELSKTAKETLIPLYKLHFQIGILLERHQKIISLQAFREEMLDQSKLVIQQAHKLSEIRSELAHTLEEKVLTEAAIKAAENKIALIEEENERQTLTLTLDAHIIEYEYLLNLEKLVARIDLKLQEAQATLAQLRTKIVSLVSKLGQDSTLEEELSAALAHLRWLSSSLEESEDMLIEQAT